MSVFIYDSFLADLRDQGDSSFPVRVLKKVFGASGSFRHDTDDHRYDGIEDAWIRYVSVGQAAFRAIYIRKGEDIYLYRAGTHAIENGLVAPTSNAGKIEVAISTASSGPSSKSTSDSPNRFLQNGRRRFLRDFMLGRRLIPHKEVILVTPFLSLGLFKRTHRFGSAIDDFLEDGCKITLITRPPPPAELDAFRELEVRGIQLLFHASLHAKLYLFQVKPSASPYASDFEDAAVLGSANLTDSGFGFDTGSFNEELCYELPPEAHARASDFATLIAVSSIDLPAVRRAHKQRM